MASIRRTLSPVPRPGSLLNGETIQVSSPLSRSSSNSPNYPPHGGSFSSSLAPLYYALYKAQSSIYSFFLQRVSRSFDRSKLKGKLCRGSFLHFLMCFFVGIFVGLTPFIPLHLSEHLVLRHQAFNFEMLHPAENKEVFSGQKNEMSVVGRISVNENSTVEPHKVNVDLEQASDLFFHKLLIIVTPTHASPLQGYYLARLGHTLKLIPHPLLWIVMEINSQSLETAELLRNTGVMYRHLTCTIKNSSDLTNVNVLLRNVALSHIEKHMLDGIVYLADDDNIYSIELFDQMRKISRIGVWTVARLVKSEGKVLLEGPICNGSQVIGWHLDNMAKGSRRFHAEISGFAFNSTILWDPKRWHRPTIEPVRQLETVNGDFQASRFMEQIVEDESQMECFSTNSSRIMVWHHTSYSKSYQEE